jgi:hypothetical protein
MRLPRWGVCALLLACQDPGDGPGAIEITGYLDSSRVSFTWDGESALAAGTAGATDAVVELSLENVRSGEQALGLSSEEGAFSLALLAAPGDTLELRASEQSLHHEVVEPPPFPDAAHVQATLEGDHALVEVSLDPPREDGRIWVVNHTHPADPVTLEVHVQGALHQGQVQGVAEDLLLLWFVPDDGPASAPIEHPISP